MSPTKRQIIDTTWQPAHERNYLRVAEFTRPGSSFPDIIFGRSNGTDVAVKALTVIVPQDRAADFAVTMTFEDILHTLLGCIEQSTIVLIHQNRPITYLPWSDDGTETELRYNVQVELPGGIIEQGELKGFAAKREMLEEAGLRNHRIICLTDLYFGYLANSAGHQQERYGMSLIIATGDIGPVTTSQTAEGIVKAELVPLTDIHKHLDNLAETGHLIEWAAYLGTERLTRLLLAQHTAIYLP